ncbi:MAG TPA: hypothetical protein VFL99_06970 [Segeticoccus sp.]|uniref:hypothetical protein n=1 Tax=Segeticoccus sp. TaxID=2706531 RepID=UPI002D7FE779|nr:hypothetical protein [Segeticoccus sp.]HET8600050.1 hypothetical protein [Segeticoccus sp.]
MIGDPGAMLHVDHPFLVDQCEHQRTEVQQPACSGNPLGVDLDHGIVTLPFGFGAALPVEPPSRRPPGVTETGEPLED